MNWRQCQRAWEVVRSQIMDQLARCDTEASEDRLTADEQRIFRLNEAEPYYGPTRGAGEAINRILGLGAAAGQQDWEAELGERGKTDRLVDALGNLSLDTEACSAIALLLLDHADRQAARGAAVTELLARIRWQLRANAQVQSRMLYWWTHMEGSAPVLEALS